MKILRVYTDGGFRPQLKLGAFAYAVTEGANKIIQEDVKVFKKENSTVPGGRVTNNVMEMLGVIKGLNWIKSAGFSPKEYRVYVYTDSQYVQLGVTEWMHSWRLKNWRTGTGKPVKNLDLWKQLYDLWSFDFKYLHLQWVEGHAGIPMNMYVDRLCTEQMLKYAKMQDDTLSEDYLVRLAEEIGAKREII